MALKPETPNEFNPGADRYVARKCSSATCYVPAMPGDTLCEYHYIKPHQDAAEAKCEALGLDTVEKQRAYFRQMAKRVYRKFDDDEPATDAREIARQVAHGEVTVEREPGQDSEEEAA